MIRSPPRMPRIQLTTALTSPHLGSIMAICCLTLNILYTSPTRMTVWREKMDRKIVDTSQAPAAIGPYSQAIVAGPFVFTAGQIPIDPATGEVVGGGIAEQTDRVLRNLASVLIAAGSDLPNVVKTTVYLSDMDDFQAMNKVYSRFFEQLPPARSTVEASLPRDVKVEIDAVALIADRR